MIPNKIYHGDALEVLRGWPDERVDMCVTSPPYWGGIRDYNIEGQIGFEATPEAYIKKMVEIFREVRRVLRPWGTVFINMGDCHANEQRTTTKAHSIDGNEAKYGKAITGQRVRTKGHPVIKDQELCGVPGHLVVALQADGWWRKSDIIWHKKAPMPESVCGWRWERHRVKVNGGKRRPAIQDRHRGSSALREGRHGAGVPEWKDCPGCSRCEKHDGLVLVKGAGRPNVAYDYIFLLAKSKSYFYDTEAAKECGALRNVWPMATSRYPDAHYATFPEELPRRCILAGTSAKGNCAECGRPHARVLKRGRRKRTVGWLPTCACGAGTVPPWSLTRSAVAAPRARWRGGWAATLPSSSSTRCTSGTKRGSGRDWPHLRKSWPAGHSSAPQSNDGWPCAGVCWPFGAEWVSWTAGIRNSANGVS